MAVSPWYHRVCDPPSRPQEQDATETCTRKWWEMGCLLCCCAWVRVSMRAAGLDAGLDAGPRALVLPAAH